MAEKESLSREDFVFSAKVRLAPVMAAGGRAGPAREGQRVARFERLLARRGYRRIRGAPARAPRAAGLHGAHVAPGVSLEAAHGAAGVPARAPRPRSPLFWAPSSA